MTTFSYDVPARVLEAYELDAAGGGRGNLRDEDLMRPQSIQVAPATATAASTTR